jgi:hypothetical protein
VDEIAERSAELAAGRILAPHGTAWGNPPVSEHTVPIAPLDVAGQVQTAHGLTDVPLDIVLADAYRYALDNMGFGEFGVRFPLSHGGKTLGTFSACRFGWVLAQPRERGELT